MWQQSKDQRGMNEPSTGQQSMKHRKVDQRKIGGEIEVVKHEAAKHREVKRFPEKPGALKIGPVPTRATKLEQRSNHQ